MAVRTVWQKMTENLKTAEAAAQFLALKWQQLVGAPGMDLKSWSQELKQAVVKVGTQSSGRLGEHRKVWKRNPHSTLFLLREELANWS